jgi:hypothetical protein
MAELPKLIDQGEYNGMFKHDVREGKGIMKWLDGSIFDGIWKQDTRI